MLTTILLGFGGWSGLMGSAAFLYNCEKPITHSNMLIAATSPLLLPTTLVGINLILKSVLTLIQVILSAMINEKLLITFMSSILVGASAGTGYIFAVHKLEEYKASEAQRLAMEQEREREQEQEREQEREQEETSTPPPLPATPTELMEPTSKMAPMKAEDIPIVKADLTEPESSTDI